MKSNAEEGEKDCTENRVESHNREEREKVGKNQKGKWDE